MAEPQRCVMRSAMVTIANKSHYGGAIIHIPIDHRFIKLERKQA